MTVLAAFPRLDKLVPLLGSDKDGEVLAAASVIGRTLWRSGFDWHDLRGAIEIDASAMTTLARKADPVSEYVTEQNMARFCLGRAELSANEQDFVKTAMKRMAFGDPLSEKQRRWAQAIFIGLGGAA